LLRGLSIDFPDQVWCSDITYIPMARGFMYLVAIINWFSRYVIAWRISNTLDADFCVEALKQSLSSDQPKVFNTDQGVQFTCARCYLCEMPELAYATFLYDSQLLAQ
jgi:putative transposase